MSFVLFCLLWLYITYLDHHNSLSHVWDRYIIAQLVPYYLHGLTDMVLFKPLPNFMAHWYIITATLVRIYSTHRYSLAWLKSFTLKCTQKLFFWRGLPDYITGEHCICGGSGSSVVLIHIRQFLKHSDNYLYIRNILDCSSYEICM